MDISTHLTVDHMTELYKLRVPERAKQLKLNIAHKIYYNQAPQYLQTNFKKARNRIQHTTNNQWNFVVPDVMRNESNTFYFKAIMNWKFAK